MPLDAWAGRTLDSLRSAWDVPRLVAFETVGSTNDVARDLALRGAPAFTTVIAEHQSAGRGRFGRVWAAPPGTGLLLSIILRPAGGQDTVPSVAPLRIGIAAARAIEAVAGIPTKLKWPNDVQAWDGRKLAGVLCEAATSGQRSFVVAGIGINVGQTPADWPSGLRHAATSLREVTGQDIDRTELARALIDAVRAAGPIDRPLDAAERADWHRRDALRDRAVHVDGEAAGTADGVTAQGALRLRSSRGPRLLWSGTVRIGTPAAVGGKDDP